MMGSTPKDLGAIGKDRRPTKPADLGWWTITFDPKLIELIGKARRSQTKSGRGRTVPGDGSEEKSVPPDAEPGRADHAESEAEDR